MSNRSEVVVDRISGLFWIGFGILVIVLSLSMEIREHLGATFLTGPGFLPILLGGALCVLGAVLILRARPGILAAFLDRSEAVSQRRAGAALVLMLIYGVGLVGRVPFFLATLTFIFCFIGAFNLPVSGRRQLAVLAGKAAATAAATAAVVAFVFQELFYIRLP